VCFQITLVNIGTFKSVTSVALATSAIKAAIAVSAEAVFVAIGFGNGESCRVASTAAGGLAIALVHIVTLLTIARPARAACTCVATVSVEAIGVHVTWIRVTLVHITATGLALTIVPITEVTISACALVSTLIVCAFSIFVAIVFTSTLVNVEAVDGDDSDTLGDDILDVTRITTARVSTGFVEALGSGATNVSANLALINIRASLSSALVTIVTRTREAAVGISTSGIVIAIVGPDVALINIGTLAFIISVYCFISGVAAA